MSDASDSANHNPGGKVRLPLQPGVTGKPGKDLTGLRFGRLLVIGLGPRRNKSAMWVCQCDCGNIHDVSTGNLFGGITKSCGCLRRDSLLYQRDSHGNTSGKRPSPTYLSWVAMKNRCLNPKNEKYPTYGGRGITVCDRWKDSFQAFLDDMGERPIGRTIDRIDGKGNYEPGNCRWATQQEQLDNRDKTGLRWRGRRTHCPAGHPFDGENTYIARDGARKCRACQRDQANARYKPRQRLKNAQCHKGHMHDEKNTYTAPNGDRRCRECNRLQAEKQRAKRRAAARGYAP